MSTFPLGLFDYLNTKRHCKCHGQAITHYWTMTTTDYVPPPSCPVTHEKCEALPDSPDSATLQP